MTITRMQLEKYSSEKRVTERRKFEKKKKKKLGIDDKLAITVKDGRNGSRLEGAAKLGIGGKETRGRERARERVYEE